MRVKEAKYGIVAERNVNAEPVRQQEDNDPPPAEKPKEIQNNEPIPDEKKKVEVPIRRSTREKKKPSWLQNFV